MAGRRTKLDRVQPTKGRASEPTARAEATALPPPPSLSRRARVIVTALLVLGFIFCAAWIPSAAKYCPRLVRGDPHASWLAVGRDLLLQGLILLLSAVIAIVPWSRRILLRAIERARHPTPRARRTILLAVFAGSALYLYSTAIFQGRTLMPILHDEQEYRIQTQMLSVGRLWIPEHPLADFFETFYVFVRPVYASIYFPGTSLLHVPAVWLGLPYFLTPLLIASLTAMLLYRVISDLIDGTAGLVSVVLLLSLTTFRWMSVMEMSHATALFWAVFVAWTWLRWRGSQRDRGHANIGWIILGGAAAGWFAITRPLDAACAVLPITIAWAVDLLRERSARQVVVSAACALLAALPFIALQLVFDHGVTGQLLKSPLAAYDTHYFNIHGLGFPSFNPSFHPPTKLPQFQALYDDFLRPQLEMYTPAGAVRQMWSYRLPLAAGITVPSSLLLILLPVGLFGLTDRRRWAIWLVLPLYMGAMFFYFSFLGHYCAVFIPAVLLMLLLGADVLRRAWPAGGILRVFLPIAMIGLALLAFPEINGRQTESSSNFPLMEINYLAIPKAVEEPAIVLFRYDVGRGYRQYDQEPVYNWNVAWPDDAPIIRAHDLGDAEDARLFDYYAKLQPDRRVYRFDRGTMSLNFLGRVTELAARHPVMQNAATRPGGH